MSDQPVIRLWRTEVLGLILLRPSGVRYSNQVGGTACFHFEEEGYYVPVAEKAQALAQLFTSGACGEGLVASEADKIDEVLVTLRLQFLKVDRSRLKNSCEAWVYVDVSSMASQGHASSHMPQ